MGLAFVVVSAQIKDTGSTSRAGRSRRKLWNRIIFSPLCTRKCNITVQEILLKFCHACVPPISKIVLGVRREPFKSNLNQVLKRERENED